MSHWNPVTGEAFDGWGVKLGKFDTYEAANVAMRAALLPAEFWYPISLPPIALLRELGEFVINKNERRQPKWKFRFGPDIAVQLQPKVTQQYAILFNGMAVRCAGVTVEAFKQPKTLQGKTHVQIGFRLSSKRSDPGVWEFKPGSVDRYDVPWSVAMELRASVIEGLRKLDSVGLTAAAMLSPSCMICGKALSDPISTARSIGPECFGSSSNNLPRVFKAIVDEEARRLLAQTGDDVVPAEQIKLPL
jgi:Family of unknown function (DUF6011)